MESMINYQDSAFINFQDYEFTEHGAAAYRWVNIKRFRIQTEEVPDTALLAMLIDDEKFRDDYAGGGVEPDEIRHGPYWLRLVTPDVYEAVSPEESTRILYEWAEQFGALPAELEAELRQAVFAPVASADSRYYLSGLTEAHFHDWGGVHCDFHEFVLIDRAASLLTLLVAADD